MRKNRTRTRKPVARLKMVQRNKQRSPDVIIKLLVAGRVVGYFGDTIIRI